MERAPTMAVQRQGHENEFTPDPRGTTDHGRSSHGATPVWFPLRPAPAPAENGTTVFMKKLLLLLPLLALCPAPLLAADWQRATVPGAWEENGPPAARNYDGVAWYRTWVKVHDSFFTKHDRNLFEESVSVNIRDLADAHEVYVNGVKIGAGGQLPPNFVSGRKDIHRHKVPLGTLHKGEWNEIALRVYNQSGPGGFLGEAPFVMNYFMECIMAGPWEFALGDDYKPGGALVTPPATTAFDAFRESNRVLGRSAQTVTGPKLSPADSFAKMKSADDLKVDLLLSEPLVAQGTHLSFDERGRLWVAQYRQYPYPAGVNMVSRDKFYRSHYDRTPPPPPNHDRGADIISIHEDTNGDGIFDRHKVFQDGLNMANAVVRGRGGVWVMNTPYLMFYPDKNFDDIPDGPPVVHLQGFGLEDTHSVANGLIWGADGWLYGGQGSTTSSRVTRAGMDPPDTEGVYFEGCMVWRYHPETREYEIFAEGSGNTFGLEMDAQGRLYSGHNGGETRGWHYVQGGFYQMQGVDPGKFGPPRNPYAFGDLPKMRALAPVRRFSHLLSFAEGTAMPGKHQGRIFAIDPLHNEVIEAERLVRGSTFETQDVGRPMWSEDVAFRPIFIVNAPDGSLYVSDMYEFYIAHGQHYQSQIDPSTGRIYRLRGATAPLERDTNLEKKSSDQLVALLSHPNKWHRHTATFVLGERKDRSVAPKLQRILAENRDLGALNALWTLHQMGALDNATIKSAFSHPYAPVRYWAVRLLGDNYGINRGLGLPGIPALKRVAHTLPPLPDAYGAARPGAAKRPTEQAVDLPAYMMTALADLARREGNAEVRSQIAGTARRLSNGQALSLAALLASHDEDVDDPFVPLMVWWILEAHLSVNLEAVVNVFKTAALWERPMVQQHLLPRLMRRFALEGRRQDLLICAQLLKMAPSSALTAPLMEGFQEAYRGRAMVGLPEELQQALAASGQAPLISRVRQGDEAAVREALSMMADKKAQLDQRIFYARVFGEARVTTAVPALLAIAGGAEPPALRKAALVSLMAYDQPEIGRAAEAFLPETAGEVRTATLSLLASRALWSIYLLNAIQAGKIAANAVSADIVDRIRAHDNRLVSDLAAKVFPPSTASAGADWNKSIAEVEAKLKQGTGNPYQGETIYSERCASCHKLFFKGGKIGPELTNYQRDNLGTMLLSIVNPNAEIREGYQYYMVETTDGRSLSGFLVERDTQIVVLRGLEGEDITLRAVEIKGLQPMGRSLMPEGLLDHLTDQQIRDFFAYLRISQPITR
ncbi:MAG: hypothetical protein RIQ93_2603 [Verrucomicrobiota bacterium]